MASLEAHNAHRLSSPHYGTLLELDHDLCKDAQSYADKLASADNGLQHDNVQGQGENLAWNSGGRQPTAREVVHRWYRERQDGSACMGHYTQVGGTNTLFMVGYFLIIYTQAFQTFSFFSNFFMFFKLFKLFIVFLPFFQFKYYKLYDIL